MKKANKGFTLLEILLVVAALAILAGIVILALNPGKQLADTKNAQRSVDVNTLLNAVYQEALDNDGTVNANIADCDTTCTAPTATEEICRTDVDPPDCTDLIDLSSLVSDYITDITTDPVEVSTYGAGYHICKETTGRITVCAPGAERSAVISVTR